MRLSFANGDPKVIHVLLVCDTDTDEKVGPTVKIDLENMKKFFAAGTKDKGVRLELTPFVEGKATPTEVLNYYENLKTGPDDCIVFYYSGHGATDTTGVKGKEAQAGVAAIRDGHFLAMKRGSLSRKKLRDKILSKPHRLAVLLTDCCSSRVAIDGRGPGAGALAQLMNVPRLGRPGEVNASTFGSLFLRSKGIADITAASLPTYTVKDGRISEVAEGQTAVCNKEEGGAFTYIFLCMMGSDPVDLTSKTKYPDEKRVDWVQLWGKLQTGTYYHRLGMEGPALAGVDRNDRVAVVRRLEDLSKKVRASGEQRPYFFKLGDD
jgi:hypothetical protein